MATDFEGKIEDIVQFTEAAKEFARLYDGGDSEVSPDIVYNLTAISDICDGIIKEVSPKVKKSTAKKVKAKAAAKVKKIRAIKE